MNEMARNIPDASRKAILAHQRNFAYGRASVLEGEVIAVVDRTAEPAVVTYLGVDEEGGPLYGRRRLPPESEGLSLQEGVSMAVAHGAPVRIALSEVLDFFGARGRPSSFERYFATSFAVRNRDAVAEEDLTSVGAAMLVAGGAQQVLSRLDAGALKALACIRDFDRAPYAFYALKGPRGEARRQAADVYPLLAGDFTAKPVLKIAIDDRKPLADLIERSYGADETGKPYLGKALLRRLQGNAFPDHGIPVVSLVKALGELPADWFPKSREEWDAFCKLADTGFSYFANEIGERVDRLTAGAGGRWCDLVSRVAKAGASTFPPDHLDEAAKRSWRPKGDETAEGINGLFSFAHDMVSQFRDQVVLPVAALGQGASDLPIGMEARQLAFQAAARLLFAGKSLTAIMEMQRDWHVQVPKILEATGHRPERAIVRAQEKTVAEGGWAPLCDIWEAPNRVSIVPLTHEDELKAEGSYGPDPDGVPGLHHCVGGYASSCRAGGHILSLRFVSADGSFQRLSTAEIGKLNEGNDELTTRQHRGKGNGAPPKPAAEAYEWFLGEVRNGRIPLNRAGVMTYLSGKQAITDEISRRAGYDRREEEIVQKVLDSWRPFLPKRLREASAEQVRESAEMGAIVEEVAPAYRGGLAFTR